MTTIGGCEKCKRTTIVYSDSERKGTNELLVCDSCYEKYYSESSIRDAKLENLLKEPLWRRILKIFK